MFDNFTPEQGEKQDVPFFDDAIAAEGWEGHRTTLSIDRLQSELAENLDRLGIILTRVEKGRFGNRHGFRLHFANRTNDGGLVRNRLDIACLPLDPTKRLRQDYRSSRPKGVDWRIEATQKMALFMVSKAVKGMWFLQVLAPAYVPFMSSMLLNDSKTTMGEAWLKSGNLTALMPPKEEDFTDEEEIIDVTE